MALTLFRDRLLDLLLPPLCLACDARVGQLATLCPGCWPKLDFIAPPLCGRCGEPFNIPAGEGMLCGRCVAEPPVYARARAALRYDEASRPLILQFKHGDRTHAAPALGAWMARAGGELIASADALLPVPLHRWRLFQRRYNQSALLAHQIARTSGKPLWPDALRRTRATPSQGRRKRAHRQENVRGAFALHPAYAARVAGKNLLLIDDVMTTGATVEECARVLLKAGAARVDALVLSRVRSVT